MMYVIIIIVTSVQVISHANKSALLGPVYMEGG